MLYLCVMKNFQLSTFNFPFIRVVIVEDHTMVADGFERLVNDSENMRVIGKAYSGAGCMELLTAAPCDVALLDVGLPDVQGIDLCLQIKEIYPHVKVMMLTSYGELFTIKRALNAGADGYLMKSCTQEELHDGIRTVASGERFLCEQANVIIQKSAQKQLEFSRREMELLQLIAEGKTIEEQVEKMCLGQKTISNYRQRLYLKFDAHNTVQLVQKARELGLV